jgi:hypothetical protein
MNDLLKFYCDFGGGTTCLVTLDLVEYRRDPKNLRPKTKWVGERTDEMFPKYQAWIHTVNRRIAETVKRDHSYVIQTWLKQPHWQFWIYHPNGDQKLVAEADGKFDPAWLGR